MSCPNKKKKKKERTARRAIPSQRRSKRSGNNRERKRFNYERHEKEKNREKTGWGGQNGMEMKKMGNFGIFLLARE